LQLVFATDVFSSNMPLRFLRHAFLLALLLILSSRALGADDLVRHTWTVDGVEREALVRVPPGVEKGGAPVVFVFHGHMGTMAQASRSMPIHEHWPEAIVVYPQGLPTPGTLTDPSGKKPGWQSSAGAQGDRDLKFFDVMFADLVHRYRPDERRIYATGHSNGGGFTYLLWAERGDKFAALAPSAAVLGRGYQNFRPKPILHLGSPQDPLVKFSWQASMIDYVLKLDGCGPRRPDTMGYTVYPSSKGAEVATYLHDGGHRYPAAAPELIVKFFQAHPASVASK
jgi:polyhydroxybutyrate depolymerase